MRITILDSSAMDFRVLGIACSFIALTILFSPDSLGQTRQISQTKYQAIQKWLDDEPYSLIEVIPQVETWSEAKMQQVHEDLKREGFEDPHWAIQENPRLLTMNHQRRVESIQFLLKVWNLRQDTLFEMPLLVGHYIPKAFSYFNSLNPAKQQELRDKLSEGARIAILLAIRAKDFRLPGYRRAQAYRLAERYGCTGWVSSLLRRRTE